MRVLAQVTENGMTVTIPTPHIFRFTINPKTSKPCMHHKILSTDPKWLPALKDGQNDVIYENDGEGVPHWSTDPDGIEIVTEWPNDDEKVPWSDMHKDWAPDADMRKEGNPLTKVMKTVGQCEAHADDYDWLPSHSDWWENWKDTMVDVGRDVQAVGDKAPYHPDLDPATNRHRPFEHAPRSQMITWPVLVLGDAFVLQVAPLATSPEVEICSG